jgi:hypothetical protein
MPEGLAGVYVGQMNFDERDGHTGQRIADRDTGVCVGRRIDEDEIDPFAPGLLDTVDQSALMIALEAVDPHPGRRASFRQAAIDGVQRLLAVYGRLAAAQQVKIRSVQHEYRSHRIRCRGRDQAMFTCLSPRFDTDRGQM